METGGTIRTPINTTRGSGGATSSEDSWRRLRLGSVENPFTFKVGQIFTGFGVGCGVGIGVGRPIYLGAIPALQQVLVATRGATDIFSGAGRHLNSSLRKFGVKGIEAGIGCGVGFGHGFGVGLAIKPSAIQWIQTCFGQIIGKIMTTVGMPSGMSSFQNVIPASMRSYTDALSGSRALSSSSSGSHLQTSPQTTGSVLTSQIHNGNSSDSKNFYPGTRGMSEVSSGTRTEKVLNDFLANPVLKNNEMDLNVMAENLRSENNILQMLLKHQQTIEKLVEENEKLRRALIDDLGISPSKLKSGPEIVIKSEYSCSDCYECRRKLRKRQMISKRTSTTST